MKTLFQYDLRLRGEQIRMALSVAIAFAILCVVRSLGWLGDGSVLSADNLLLTSTMVTRECMRVLENTLSMTKCSNRQFDPKFGVEGAKIGQIVNARKPIRVVGRVGQAARVESITETSVPVALTTQAGVDLEIS